MAEARLSVAKGELCKRQIQMTDTGELRQFVGLASVRQSAEEVDFIAYPTVDRRLVHETARPADSPVQRGCRILGESFGEIPTLLVVAGVAVKRDRVAYRDIQIRG